MENELPFFFFLWRDTEQFQRLGKSCNSGLCPTAGWLCQINQRTGAINHTQSQWLDKHLTDRE